LSTLSPNNCFPTMNSVVTIVVSPPCDSPAGAAAPEAFVVPVAQTGDPAPSQGAGGMEDRSSIDANASTSPHAPAETTATMGAKRSMPDEEASSPSEKKQRTDRGGGGGAGTAAVGGKSGGATHSAEVLRANYPLRPGQPKCEFYMRNNSCKFGLQCRYDHPRDIEPKLPPPGLALHGYPLRPGEQECPYYMRNGHCSYSPNCHYHHPLEAPAYW
ncbi:unnamed protein product, partial [Phaeothamnion confervicola]